MRRRGRRRRPRASQSGAQIVQIVGLGLILLIILLFRDEVGENAGKFFSAMGSEDVQVEATAPDAGGVAPSNDGADAGPDAN